MLVLNIEQISKDKVMLSRITIIMIFFLLIISRIINADDIPLKPKHIPAEATWNSEFTIWVFKDKQTDNYYNYYSWYANGNKRLSRVLLNKDYEIITYYYENGVIKKRGMDYNFKNLHDILAVVGWQPIGKWKEYDEHGIIQKEYCYSLLKNKSERIYSDKCGEEIIYDAKGKVKKKIKHKLKCEYGCDEPPVESEKK